MASNRDSAIVLPQLDTNMETKTDFSQPLEGFLDTGVLKGKTAIVQDGVNGLGLGIATALAERGAKVAICGSNATAGEAVEKDITEKGHCLIYIKTDTSDWNSLLSAFKQVIAWSDDQLDIVVTSAGIVTHNMLVSALPRNHRAGADPPKPPTNTLEVNMMGVYFTTSLAIWYFNQLESKRLDPDFNPQLLFICSMAGYDGLEFGTDYAASKHAVRAIWKTTRRPRPTHAQYQSNLLAPTYVSKKKIAGESEKKLRDHNTQTNELEDVVAGALRCLCDKNVTGKAVCCVQGSTGTPGCLNFDLCDDLAGGNGGKELKERAEDLWLPSSATLKEDSDCAVQ
jgi:5'-hydroxyaverantin dehydrogenase